MADNSKKTNPGSPRKKVEPRCVKYGPPEKSPEQLRELEKGFILDCMAVSTFSDDSGHASPKLSTAIPPYNAQKDKNAKRYFEVKDVKRTLKRTGQVCLISYNRNSFQFNLCHLNLVILYSVHKSKYRYS